MELEQEIKKIEEFISEGRFTLAINTLQGLIERDVDDYFREEKNALLGLERRYNVNESAYKIDATLTKQEYDLELSKIERGILKIKNLLKDNPDQLGFEEELDTSVMSAFVPTPSESLVDRASKIVMLFLMGAAAILLIYFIAFHKDEDTQLTGILASGGVVFGSLFKQTLDKYINLRFS
ncbi:MAG: hypothetical protein AAF696_16965 [Bacteroidota bacterium]